MGKFSTTPKFFVEYTMLPFSKPSFLLLAVSTMACLVHAAGDEAPKSEFLSTWRVKDVKFFKEESFFGASARPIGTNLGSPTTPETTPETPDGNNLTLTFSVTKIAADEEIMLTAVGDAQAGQRSEKVLFIHPKYDEITHEGNVVIVKTEDGANTWKLVCLSDLHAKQLTFFMNFVMPNCVYRGWFRHNELAICADAEGTDLEELRVITGFNEYKCFKVTTKICKWKKSKTPALTLCEKPCIPSVARSDPTNQLPEFLKQLKAYTSCVVGGINFRRGLPERCAFITKLEKFAEPPPTGYKRRLRGVSPVMLRLLEQVEEI